MLRTHLRSLRTLHEPLILIIEWLTQSGRFEGSDKDKIWCFRGRSTISDPGSARQISERPTLISPLHSGVRPREMRFVFKSPYIASQTLACVKHFPTDLPGCAADCRLYVLCEVLCWTEDFVGGNNRKPEPIISTDPEVGILMAPPLPRAWIRMVKISISAPTDE